MAIKELQSLITGNYNVLKTASFHAGQVLGRDSATGLVRPSDRAIDTAAAIVGFSADDKARVGNTMILIDPVGANNLSDLSSAAAANGSFVSGNNGFYVAAKRALGDYQDETVTNMTNLTDGASGYTGPRRGVGVFISPSGQFATDMFAMAKTGDTVGSSPTYADTSFSGIDTFLPNDLLTVGTGVNAGLLVKVVNGANNGKLVAKVDAFDAGAGLLYVTQL